MLDKSGMPATEVGQRLGLHPVAPHGVTVAVKQVPSLADNVAADYVPGVHANRVEIPGTPDADLIHQVVNVEPEQSRRIIGRGHVHHPGGAVRRSDRSNDRDPASRIGRACKPADLSDRPMRHSQDACKDSDQKQPAHCRSTGSGANRTLRGKMQRNKLTESRVLSASKMLERELCTRTVKTECVELPR